ncbi:MAG: slipin family protein, partial [Pseudomonadota bacterium]
MIMTLMNVIRGRTRITVKETERVLVLNRGRFTDILGPGEHWIAARGLELERHDLSTQQVGGAYLDALRRARPDLVEAHMTDVRTGEDEVTLIFRDETYWGALRTPKQRATLWTDAGPWEIVRFAVTEDLTVPAEARR